MPPPVEQNELHFCVYNLTFQLHLIFSLYVISFQAISSQVPKYFAVDYSEFLNICNTINICILNSVILLVTWTFKSEILDFLILPMTSFGFCDLQFWPSSGDQAVDFCQQHYSDSSRRHQRRRAQTHRTYSDLCRFLLWFCRPYLSKDKINLY